ncbi:hypothetical protein A2U01_0107887, partial [Trifolium medium]|nr:hypothetical protein [Trifolium medium]
MNRYRKRGGGIVNCERQEWGGDNCRHGRNGDGEFESGG